MILCEIMHVCLCKSVLSVNVILFSWFNKSLLLQTLPQPNKQETSEQKGKALRINPLLNLLLFQDEVLMQSLVSEEFRQAGQLPQQRQVNDLLLNTSPKYHTRPNLAPTDSLPPPLTKKEDPLGLAPTGINTTVHHREERASQTLKKLPEQ